MLSLLKKVLYLSVLCCSPFVYGADEPDNPLIWSTLDRALKDLKARRVALDSAYLVHYQKQETDRLGNYKTWHIQQSNSGILSTQPIATSGTMASEQGVDLDFELFVNFSTAAFETAKFVAENDTHYTFEIATPIAASSDSGSVSETDISDANASLQSNLTTLVNVSKTTARLSSMRIFAVDSFKPNLLTRVKTFNITMEFDESFKGGPLYVKRHIRELKGRYGLLIAIDQYLETSIANLEFAAQ